MKKQFLLFVAAITISITSLMAQGGRPMPTPEERTKVAMEKLAEFNLKTDTRTQVESILTNFYSSQQSAMKEMRASGSTDRAAMMEKNKQLAGERDGKLKQILTTEEYNRWITDVEPSLRLQKPTMAPPVSEKKAPAEKQAAPAKPAN